MAGNTAYVSQVVIIEQDIDVEGGVGVGVSVREIDTRVSGRVEGVNRWTVREVFRTKLRGMSLSKPEKSDVCVCYFLIFMTSHGELNIG